MSHQAELLFAAKLNATSSLVMMLDQPSPACASFYCRGLHGRIGVVVDSSGVAEPGTPGAAESALLGLGVHD